MTPSVSTTPFQQLDNQNLFYFKSHLAVAGFRGHVYQMSHFTYFCLHHLFKERAFKGAVEIKEHGNLDDIQIELAEKVKAYQVKLLENPITLDDFWRKKGSKNAPLDMGKFFIGWLSLRINNVGKKIIPYLLTNTQLNWDLEYYLEVVKASKTQLKFQEAFIKDNVQFFEDFYIHVQNYLYSKKYHSFLGKNDSVKREEFKCFLKAFRFNINRESFEEIQKYIQSLLETKYGDRAPLLYPHIKYAIEYWYTQKAKIVNVINNDWLWDAIKKSDSYQQAIDKLSYYGLSLLTKVHTTIQRLPLK